MTQENCQGIIDKMEALKTATSCLIQISKAQYIDGVSFCIDIVNGLYKTRYDNHFEMTSWEKTVFCDALMVKRKAKPLFAEQSFNNAIDDCVGVISQYFFNII